MAAQSAAAQQLIALTVISDAVFAMAAGDISGWSGAVTERPAPTGFGDGVDAAHLVREVTRRLAVLRTGDDRLRPEEDHPRPVTPLDQWSGNPLLTAHERDVLRLSNGRRSVRELAFHLHRTLFGVCLDVIHLLERGLITVGPPTGPPGAGGGTGTSRARVVSVADLLRPRSAVERDLGAGAGDAHVAESHRTPAPAAAAGARPPLSRRVPGAAEAARILRRARGNGGYMAERSVEVEGH